MADIEGMVNSMGMTFFCNAMVEGLYYFRKNGSMSKELKENCKKGIAEFESLKWPLASFSVIRSDLFNSNQNIDTFEKVCGYYKTPAGQMIDGTIADLKYILSENPINKKLKLAHKLQLFFDVFGDYSYYATRDCVRC